MLALPNCRYQNRFKSHPQHNVAYKDMHNVSCTVLLLSGDENGNIWVVLRQMWINRSLGWGLFSPEWGWAAQPNPPKISASGNKTTRWHSSYPQPYFCVDVLLFFTRPIPQQTYPMLLSSHLAHPNLTMPRLSLSSLSKPIPAYIPTRLIPGLPGRCRRSSAKRQEMHTRSEARPQKAHRRRDSMTHRKDVDFITSLFVVEQLECERWVLSWLNSRRG